MGILIDKVRIANYRAIKNLEVSLSKLTMLVGANNSGKTSFLKALNLALGIDRKIVNREDVHDDGTSDVYQKEIIIDVRIIPIDEHGNRSIEFEQAWSETDGMSGNFKSDNDSNAFFAFRTRYKFDLLSQTFKQEAYILKEWLPFDEWTASTNEDRRFQKIESIPLIFVDAQRDIQADLKDKSSFLGRMTNKPDINPENITTIESQINDLNTAIIAGSSNLKKLQEKLKDLNKTVLSSTADGVEITPVNKKIRDIGRNLNINFNDTGSQSFPLEYHGMGTRSWASLLTLNAFISWQEEINKPYLPILALEEPEAHLHPNAQRQLYYQLNSILGQKIISTHSPFVAAQCDLMDLRHFYKDGNDLKVGQLELNSPTADFNIETINDLNYFVIQNRGEILYSKAIVLTEGATEEQALPLLYYKRTGKQPFEHGVNFISVNGKNYYPFLVLANFLNIKWFVLSDGDNNTEVEVKAQIDKITDTKNYEKLFVFDNVDFEEYLVNHDYTVQIIKAINDLKGESYFPKDFINEFDQQKMKGGNVRNYKGDADGGTRRALLDCMRKNKTDLAKKIASEICNKKGKDEKMILPPKIEELFKEIASDLKIELP